MIAVCMIAFNQLWYTRTAVESIRKNSVGHDLELFLLDNGSTDETGSYMMSTKPTAFIRSHKNMGISWAWNKILDAALASNPEIICLAGNDIVTSKGWLDPIVREVSKNPKRYFIPNGEISDWENIDVEASRLYPARRGKTCPGRSGWCFFFTPDAVREFLPVPPELFLWYGDDYIHWKLKNAGYPCEVVLDSFVCHFLSKTIMSFDSEWRNRRIAQDRDFYNRLTGENL